MLTPVTSDGTRCALIGLYICSVLGLDEARMIVTVQLRAPSQLTSLAILADYLDSEETNPVLLSRMLQYPKTLQALKLSVVDNAWDLECALFPTSLVTLRMGCNTMPYNMNTKVTLGHFQTLRCLVLWGRCEVEESLLGQLTCLQR